jgi:murein DD-endopeptidase MepM/ murein hydrolase activator NlpD
MRAGRWPIVLIVVAVVGTACGQWEGAHQPTLDERLSRPVGANLTIRPNNGENSGPNQKLQRTVVLIKKRVPANESGPGPLFICPVQARGSFSDDYGAPRFAGGYHPHQGNDMFAPLGSPIVAPFEGRAVPSPNALGGLAVKVFGRDGYVYNAHLSAYAPALGDVTTGTTIGFVGNTGDALGGPPHDHFEWHPNNGHAVNPNPFLKQVCR